MTSRTPSSICEKEKRQRLFAFHKQHRFVPGKCRSLTYRRPPIDRMLRNHINIVYNAQDDYNRELLSRAIFVEESLRLAIANNLSRVGDCPAVSREDMHCCQTSVLTTACCDQRDNAVYLPARHRCSDPRTACENARTCGCEFLRRDTGGSAYYLLPCASMYFSYFYDISRVYHVEPLEVDGGDHGSDGRECSSIPRNGESRPFGALFDANNRELYICCNERVLENSLLAVESVPDHRLLVNDTSVASNDSYTSSFDRRVFTILGLLANIERLVYDALITVTRERTLGELIFAADDDVVVDNNNDSTAKSDIGSKIVSSMPFAWTNGGSFRGGRTRNVDMPQCFL